MPRLEITARDRAILLWALTGCFIGPIGLVTGLSALGALGTLLSGQATTHMLGDVAVGALFSAIWVLAVALLVSPIVAPILALWVAAAGRWPRIETRRGIVTTSAAVAISVALLVAAAYAAMDRPFGAHGLELVGITTPIVIAVWLGLMLPRLTVHALRPGVFTRSVRADRHLPAVSAP